MVDRWSEMLRSGDERMENFDALRQKLSRGSSVFGRRKIDETIT
jgi:hypothetical protein